MGFSLVSVTLLASPASAASISGVSMPTTAPAGMTQVFSDDFNGTALDNQWFSYSGTSPTDPADTWDGSQVQVANGELTLSATATPDGATPWISGGISAQNSLTNSEYGSYFVRMKAQSAEGISDVAMLWPDSDSGPGELDFVEDGGGAKQQALGTIHYIDGSGAWAAVHSKVDADMTQWHTWGVVSTPNQLTYYLDGQVWAIQTTNDIPDVTHSFAIQTQAWPCGYNAYESCPDGTTPPVVNLQVDWVVANAFNSPPTAVSVPAVTGISPASGPQPGGTTVTLTGSGFTGSTAVEFGNEPATSFNVVSDTKITAVAPAESANTGDIIVTTPDGPIQPAAADQYTYMPTPVVTALSPSSGSQLGGTSVTLTGSGFTGTTAVNFGSLAATSFTVDSDSEITAVAPAQPTGTHGITMTTADGTSPGQTFDYIGPALTAMSPGSGAQTGGTTVTLTGSGFTGATAVDFGSLPATSFTVLSDNEITAVSPAQLGARGITVATADGTSPAQTFDYIGPALTAISPTSGSKLGGTTVTVTGSGFTGATSVMFGSVAATSFTVVSDTRITAVSPAQTGTHGISVTTADGTSSAATFSYFGPAVTAISPTSGAETGSTTVTLTGSGFTGATSVMFGSVAATSFTVVSDTRITAVSPAQSAGTHGITVTTANGSSAAVTFSYIGPAVTAISPNTGSKLGATTVTLTGSGFTGATSVMFGSVAATSFTVVSDTRITAVSPAQSGSRGISVTTPGGTTAAMTFTYIGPAVTAISPTSGAQAGGTTVTLTGSGFTGATSVAFGSMAATSFTVVSDTKITAVSPAQPAGTKGITVTTADGSSAAVTFSYIGPDVTTVSPSSGSQSGGTTVTLTGKGFTAATKVIFGSLAATSYTVVSDTKITAVSPAQSAGTHGITVTTSNGTSVPDTYTYSATKSAAMHPEVAPQLRRSII